MCIHVLAWGEPMGRKTTERMRNLVGATGLFGVLLSSVLPTHASSRATGAESLSDSGQDLFEQVVALDLDVPDQQVSHFLSLPRETQSEILQAAGFKDPGGPLTDPDVQQHLLGQWLQMSGNHVEGTQLILSSGLATPSEALAQLSSLRPQDFEPTELEVKQVAMATGRPADDSRQLAQLQLIGRALRPIARSLDPGFLRLSVNHETQVLEYATSSASSSSLFDATPFAQVVTAVLVKYSESDIVAEAAHASATLQRAGLSPGVDFRILTGKTPPMIAIATNASTAPEVRAIVTGHAASPASELVAVIVDPSVLRAAEVNDLVAGVTTAIPAYCTWGFSVAQSAEERFVTAGHCQDSQQYPFIAVNFPWTIQQNSGDIDAQVHDIPSPHTGDNRIAIDYGSDAIDITDRASYNEIDVSDILCHEGATSGYSCGIVDSVTDEQIVPAGGTHVIRIDGSSYRQNGGDSGGPYVFGQTAYGLAEGANSGGNCSEPDCIGWVTAIEFAETNLSFVVQTK